MSTFPYRKDTHGDYYPIIDLFVYHQDTFVRTSALIDSGATISVFRYEVADELGINIENGKLTLLRGIAGRIEGYIHHLKVSIADTSFTCPIVFSHEHLVSLNLLGRDVFFEQFTIIFEEKQHQLRLE